MDLGVLCLGFFGLGIFNVLEAALAYKLRLGHKPVPMETEAFWLAAVWAGLGLTMLLYGITRVLLRYWARASNRVQVSSDAPGRIHPLGASAFSSGASPLRSRFIRKRLRE